MTNTILSYVGNGSFLPNVPARDLTKEEADRYGGDLYLTSTGLYVYAIVEAEAEEWPAAEIEQKQSKKKIKE